MVVEPVTLDGVTSLPLLTVEVTRRGASMSGRVVDLRDEVVVLLAADREAVDLGGGAGDDRAGLARGLHGRVEHRMHGKERGAVREAGRREVS